MVPYGVFGVQAEAKGRGTQRRAAKVGPTILIVDPANKNNMANGCLEYAKTASGAIYEFLGIKKWHGKWTGRGGREWVPDKPFRKGWEEGEAVVWWWTNQKGDPVTESCYVAHVVGPNFRWEACQSYEEMAHRLGRAWRNLFMQIAESKPYGLVCIRLVPISGGAFAPTDPTLRSQFERATGEAMASAFESLPQGSKQILMNLCGGVTWEFCCFTGAEYQAYSQALWSYGAQVEGAPATKGKEIPRPATYQVKGKSTSWVQIAPSRYTPPYL